MKTEKQYEQLKIEVDEHMRVSELEKEGLKE